MMRFGFAFSTVLYALLWVYAERRCAVSQELNNQYKEIIESNNRKLKQLEVDIEKYKAQKPKIKKQIIVKYKNIKVKDSTCEAKLEKIQKSVDTFFDSVK